MSNKVLGAAAVVAIAFSTGSFFYSSCCQNRAKAESVVRVQREQGWRYAVRRSSLVVTAGMV
jgi:hypothetical protein